jgi:hypothetical protein
MPYREKVIKGLESCSRVDCTECQYGKEGHGHNDCVERLCADVLALVKEQEEEIKEKNARIWQLLCEKEQ